MTRQFWHAALVSQFVPATRCRQFASMYWRCGEAARAQYSVTRGKCRVIIREAARRSRSPALSGRWNPLTLRRWIRRIAVSVIALAAPLGAALAQELTIPPPRGLVNDFANVIPADQAQRIERLATLVRERSRGEIAVVTLPDIGARNAGDIALRIGREWKVGANTSIGDAARNAGVVILVVPKETSSDGSGHVFISTGQGTEGFLTDGTTGDIRREATPLLQRKDYGTAIELMTQRVAERYAANFGFTLDDAARIPPAAAQENDSRSGGKFPPGIFFLLFVVAVIVLSRGRRGSGCLWMLLSSGVGRSGGGWGGGGFGGGGGGGGGFGGFGGGGGFSGGGSGGSF